mmetsp:Transcript_29295/g.64585  ORF Transcript_29295/g.64585 Transcript_29295/m.64585 type:complete len:152 (+) Transcript_29295:53-508(+)
MAIMAGWRARRENERRKGDTIPERRYKQNLYHCPSDACADRLIILTMLPIRASIMCKRYIRTRGDAHGTRPTRHLIHPVESTTCKRKNVAVGCHCQWCHETGLVSDRMVRSHQTLFTKVSWTEESIADKKNWLQWHQLRAHRLSTGTYPEE